jgi:hypothetical protein
VVDITAGGSHVHQERRFTGEPQGARGHERGLDAVGLAVAERFDDRPRGGAIVLEVPAQPVDEILDAFRRPQGREPMGQRSGQGRRSGQAETRGAGGSPGGGRNGVVLAVECCHGRRLAAPSRPEKAPRAGPGQSAGKSAAEWTSAAVAKAAHRPRRFRNMPETRRAAGRLRRME